MALPELLMLNAMRPFVEEALAPHFRVHRAWELTDGQRAEIASGIQAIAGFGGQIDGATMDGFPALRIIATASVGYDGIDAVAAAERGIVVTNTPDVLTDEVADLALGLLLATVREIPRAERHLREGRWPAGPYPLTATLRNRSVGIVGLGRIGKAIAQRIEGFGLPVAYHGRHAQDGVAYPYFASLDEMAGAVDVLIVVAPGGAGTRHLVKRETLKALGPNGILINVARGSVVDQEALIEALQDGTILAAGLDVFDDEPNVPASLAALENTVLLPHVASASHATREAMARLAVNNLIAWSEGRPPLTPIPETPWPPRG